MTWKGKKGLDEKASHINIAYYVVHADTDDELLEIMLMVKTEEKLSQGFDEQRVDILHNNIGADDKLLV